MVLAALSSTPVHSHRGREGRQDPGLQWEISPWSPVTLLYSPSHSWVGWAVASLESEPECGVAIGGSMGVGEYF